MEKNYYTNVIKYRSLPSINCGKSLYRFCSKYKIFTFLMYYITYI